MDVDHEAYAALEARLGHRFADPRLLEQALTHKSFLNENAHLGRDDNERFEFLGDALLGFAVGQLLMEAFPARSEGEPDMFQMTRAGATIARNVFLIDPSMVTYGIFDDIQVHKPAKTGDADKYVLNVEYTLIVNNEAAHGVIADTFGISAAA